MTFQPEKNENENAVGLGKPYHLPLVGSNTRAIDLLTTTSRSKSTTESVLCGQYAKHPVALMINDDLGLTWESLSEMAVREVLTSYSS